MIAGRAVNGASRRPPPRAFTLIELLVVIAIIALLMSILVPSLRRAKDLALATKCMVNLKYCGNGVLMYAEDNNGYMPIQAPGPGGSNPYYPYNWDFWTHFIAKFPPNNYGWQTRIEYVSQEATSCTVQYTDKSWDWDNNRWYYPIGQYGDNSVLLQDTTYASPQTSPWCYRISDTTRPSQTYWAVDGTNGNCFFAPDMRHAGRANYVWIDAHVKPSTLATPGMFYEWVKRPWFNSNELVDGYSEF